MGEFIPPDQGSCYADARPAPKTIIESEKLKGWERGTAVVGKLMTDEAIKLDATAETLRRLKEIATKENVEVMKTTGVWLEGMRQWRFAVETEKRSIAATLADITNYFNSVELKAACQQLREVCEAVERAKKLHDDPQTQKLIETLLKL